MRLGDLLVSAGKLTQAEVEEVLKGQAIFGGRFGTNLVEMGYLEERELAHFLSRKTGVPHATPEQVMDVPPQILKLIPEALVKKYRVIPVGLNNRKLILAMADPSNFAAIEEISFVTGYIVLPVIIPELRLVAGLEKHFQIRRELRYIKVEGGGRNRGRMASQAQAASAQAPPAQATPQQPAPGRRAQSSPPPMEIELEDADIVDLPLFSELDMLTDLQEIPSPELLPPVGTSSASAAPQPDTVLPPLSATTPEPEQDYSLKGVLLGLTRAEDRDGIADLVVNCTAQKFNRCALFLVKGGKASGWLAQTDKKPVADFEKLEIDLAEPSVLKVVADSKTFYLGPLPMTPANTTLLNAVGGGTPVNNVLVPLVMAGRAVAILYAEGSTLRPDEQVSDLQMLLGKASLAFEVLILKNKILLT